MKHKITLLIVTLFLFAALIPFVSAAPSSWDWRNVGGTDWMTSVKSQGGCGSCWAFSAVGTTEAVYNILSGDPNLDLDLSEQYLVTDCYTGSTCCGGYKVGALQYIRDSGVPDEGCMTYVDGSGCSCPGDICSSGCNYNTGGECSDKQCSDRCADWASRLKQILYVGYATNTPATIKDYLVDKGPLAVSMRIGAPGFVGDIYRCDSDSPTNHAVVIVGYDDAGGYWIVKNSWGATWGPQGNGYFKVGYGECGIEGSVYYIDKLQEGNLCSSSDDCVSGYCEGSVSNSARCCSAQPPTDAWYGGGNTPGCGDDPSSQDRDYYCNSLGNAQYEQTDTKDCDESGEDDCTSWCVGNEVYGSLDFYVILNTNTCTSTGGGLVEDCTAKTSSDTDGGNIPLIFGTVTDYTTCSAGACVGSDYDDTCQSTINLLEYFPNSAFYSSQNWSCASFEAAASDPDGDDPTTTDSCTAGTGAGCSGDQFNTTSGSGGTDQCVGTCGTSLNSCKFREYFPGDSTDACSGFDTCVYTDYDADINPNTCNECKGANFWNLGGDVSNCCGDDLSENKKTRVCNAVCTTDPTDDACCNLTSKCVYNSTCYATGYIGDPDVDTLDEKCVNGTWQQLQAGDVCNVDGECGSGYCEGSLNYTAHCCGSQPNDDDWYGGGNTGGCGADPDSDYEDYYCNSGGNEYYEVTNTKNCDSQDDCTTWCVGNEVHGSLDYFVQLNTNICDSTGGGMVEDCTAKTSSDTDGGNVPSIFGTVTDYDNCADGECVGPEYDDVCSTTTNLTEYFPNSIFHTNQNWFCASFELAASDPDGNDPTTTDSCTAGTGAGCSGGEFNTTAGSSGTDQCVGTCGTGVNSCEFREYFPGDSADACSGFDTCVYTDYDADINPNTCNECKGANFWNLGGDVPNCCSDDSSEYKKTRTCNAVCTTDPNDDACCNVNTKCVYNSTCYATGYIGDPDADTLDEKCVSGTWQQLQAGDLCNSDTECGSGYCEGSVSNASRCCGSQPTSDRWYGGGNTNGCGTDPDSDYEDYYCNSSGNEYYEVTDTQNCDSQDDCETHCVGPNVYEGIDYYVFTNSNICLNTGGGFLESCLIKVSFDTDNGDFPLIFGTVTDYDACFDGECVGPEYDDICQTPMNLWEYLASGMTYNTKPYFCTDFELAASDPNGDDPTQTEICTAGTGASCLDGEFSTIEESGGTDHCEGVCGIEENSCKFIEYFAADSDDTCPLDDECVLKNYDADTHENTCDTCLTANEHWNIGGEISETTCCGDDFGEYRKQRFCMPDACTADDTDYACCDVVTDCVYDNQCYATGYRGDVDGDSEDEKCLGGTWNVALYEPILISPDDNLNYEFQNLNFKWEKAPLSNPDAYWFDVRFNGNPVPESVFSVEFPLYVGTATGFTLKSREVELLADDGEWTWRVASQIGSQKYWSEWRTINKQTAPELFVPVQGKGVVINELFDWDDVQGANNYVVKLTGFLPLQQPYYLPLNSDDSEFELEAAYYKILKNGVIYSWSIAGTGLGSYLPDNYNQHTLSMLSYGEERNFQKG
ncbi:MAG: C1 family peptidase [Candidatus Diapherotrites archaeon]